MDKKKIFLITFLTFLLVSFIVTACKKEQTLTLKMATTTSTDNTGLLDYLKPYIGMDMNIELKWVAVGTGRALELGRNCDVDILLVHAPSAEKEYVKEGHGIERKHVMYNDFVIIGPKSDKTRIKGKSVKEAFKAIYKQKSPFASRGDNSGTNKKETGLWKEAISKIPDKESWYIQTGQGMLNTLTIAAERNAYTITDRGTYIKYEANHKGDPPLAVLVEKDEVLNNQYSIIAVNPQKCSNVKIDLARKLSQWFISTKAQKHIKNFKLMGKQLFIPNAGK